ncbi:hypothetical protein [Ensifer adhaerens]|uniref:hypothetical protein n=1 Tax=Ensifer adhaerens TaxID=106592 RepID=UPI0011788655|nr:hypothetical protein [Ensifer adhaerens]
MFMVGSGKIPDIADVANRAGAGGVCRRKRVGALKLGQHHAGINRNNNAIWPKGRGKPLTAAFGENRMIRSNRRPYDTYSQDPKTPKLQALRDFGLDGSRRLPNFGRERSDGRNEPKAIEVAEGGPGGTMGGLAGGWLGGVLGSRLPLGEFGKWAGRYLGAKAGEAIGSHLDGPVPESVARGVMTPAERDYPGYWGYSGDDAVGGWRLDRPRQEKAATAQARDLPKAYADRIAQEFGNEWGDAHAIYNQNPKFWKEAYQGDPSASKTGPKSVSTSRTSRLPEPPVPETSANEAQPNGRGFWENLFPGRSSLREAQGRWRE